MMKGVAKGGSTLLFIQRPDGHSPSCTMVGRIGAVKRLAIDNINEVALDYGFLATDGAGPGLKSRTS